MRSIASTAKTTPNRTARATLPSRFGSRMRPAITDENDRTEDAQPVRPSVASEHREKRREALEREERVRDRVEREVDRTIEPVHEHGDPERDEHDADEGDPGATAVALKSVPKSRRASRITPFHSRNDGA